MEQKLQLTVVWKFLGSVSWAALLPHFSPHYFALKKLGFFSATLKESIRVLLPLDYPGVPREKQDRAGFGARGQWRSLLETHCRDSDKNVSHCTDGWASHLHSIQARECCTVWLCFKNESLGKIPLQFETLPGFGRVSNKIKRKTKLRLLRLLHYMLTSECEGMFCL